MTGEFRSNGQLADYSEASLFEQAVTPFIRAVFGGGNSDAPDLKAPVRSFALSFAMSPTEQWRIAMNTPPVMAVKDPHTFYQQIQAIQAGLKQYRRSLLSTLRAATFDWKSAIPTHGSFAAETYNSINAFYLVNSNGDKQAVRWGYATDGFGFPRKLERQTMHCIEKSLTG